MKKENGYYDGNIFLQGLIKGIIVGTVVIAACIALFALIITLLDLPRSVCGILSLASMSVGSFFAALCCGKTCGEGGLKCGAVTGGIFFAVFAIVTGILGTATILMDLFVRLVCCMLSSLAGGVIGVNTEGKSKFKI